MRTTKLRPTVSLSATLDDKNGVVDPLTPHGGDSSRAVRSLSPAASRNGSAQHEIFDRQGFVARVDFAYPDRRIAIELDSRRHHLNAVAFENDRRKRNRLALDGWLVIEITWRMLIDQPHLVVRGVCG